MIIDVLVEININKKDKTFSYSVPKSLESEIKLGKRVLVPFGKQTLEGFILKIHNTKPDYELKDIIKVIDKEEILNKELLELGKEISDANVCNLVSVYQAMLPRGYKAKAKETIKDKKVSYVRIIDRIKANEFLKESRSTKQKEIIIRNR